MKNINWFREVINSNIQTYGYDFSGTGRKRTEVPVLAFSIEPYMVSTVLLSMASTLNSIEEVCAFFQLAKEVRTTELRDDLGSLTSVTMYFPKVPFV